MKSTLPVIGLAAGFGLGIWAFSVLQVPGDVATLYAPYLSLATLAGLDTVLGGVKSGIDGDFKGDIFVSGFLLNTLLAAGLAYLGDKIGVDLFLAAVVALGTRVFLNLSIIRRHLLERLASRNQPAPAPLISE